MTDLAPPSPPAAEPPTPAPAPKKKRNWRRRFRILVLLLLIGVAVFRVALNVLLPTVINRVAGLYDLEAGYDRLGLSLLGGNAQLYGLKLRPKGGGESVLQAEYLQGDLSPLNLFRGRLVVYRAEADGVVLAIDREADGSIPLLKRFLSAQAKTAPAATQPATPISLDAPLRVDALRVSHVSARVRDKSVTPVFEAVVRTDLRVSDVGQSTLPTKFELVVTADPLLDTLRIIGQAKTAPNEVTAEMTLLARGLHPPAAAGYLNALGLHAVGQDVTAEAKLSLAAKTIPNSADFAVDAKLTSVKAVADGEAWASLRELSLKATQIGPAAAMIDTLTIDGGRAKATRTAAGEFQIAGLAPSPLPGPTGPKTGPVASSSTNVAPPAGPPFRVAVGALNVTDCEAVVTDGFVTPAADWVARLESLSVGNFDTAATAPVPFKAAVGLPGIMRRVTADGRVAGLAARKTLDVRVAAEGVRPDLLAPYLRRVGVESRLNDASFTADVSASFVQADGKLTADFAARNVAFSDGPEPLVTLNRAVIDAVSYTPADGSIDVKAIDVSGPAMAIVREADGTPTAAGFAYVGRAERPPSFPLPVPRGRVREGALPNGEQPRPVADPLPNSPPRVRGRGDQTDAATRPAFALPRVHVGRFQWADAKLKLEDRVPASASTLTIDNAGIDVENFALDLAATRPLPPGKFTAWLAAPGLADTLTAAGTFAPGPGRLTVTVNAGGDGLNAKRLSPYLTPLGVELTMAAGRFAAAGSGTLSRTPDGIGLDVEAHDTSLFDGDQTLLSVAFAGVNGLSVTPGRIDADAINLVKPYVRARRLADGTPAALGVRLLPAAAGPTTRPAPRLSTSRPATTPADVGLRLSPLLIELGVRALRVIDASMHVTDEAASPAAELKASANLTLDNLNVAETWTPAYLKADAVVDGVLGVASAEGTLLAAPTHPWVALHLNAADVRPGPLGSYLPVDVRPVAEINTFGGDVTAIVSNAKPSGLAGRVAVEKLVWGAAVTLPADRRQPIIVSKAAGLDAFRIDARRIDPAEGTFEFDAVTLSGAEAVVRKTGDVVSLAGWTVRPKPAAAPTTAPATRPASQTTAPVDSLSTIVADARRPLPYVAVDVLDLKVKSFIAGGFTGDGAADVTLRDARLSSPGPIRFGGRRAADLPPIVLKAEGGVDPVVGRFDVSATVTPLAVEPTLSLDVSAVGLRGDGLAKLLPSLASRLDGSKLTAGTFRTHLDAGVNYGRRGPRDFDLGRGFTASLDVRPVELRATADGPVQAGVAGVRVDGVRVDPPRGNVTVGSIEVDTPTLRAFRDDRGINVAGLTLLLGHDESAETLTAATAPSAPTPAGPPVDAPPATRPTGEIRLDRFTVSGGDVVVEDRTGRPTTVVPLRTLDVDVQGLSSQLPWSGKKVRFNVLATGGKVALPPRKGAKGEASTQPTDSGEYTESRELFSQVAAAGNVGFARSGDAVTLDGWAKTSVSGFELLGVRGLASQFDVTVGGGSFDNTNDIRFNPAGLIETRNKIVFTNLSLSEPENGPIRRLLKLPAPIDVAIAAVTDPDGSITLNVPVPVKNGAINPGDVVGPALGAVANVLATGIASAPVKAVAGIGALVGFGKKEAQPEPPVTVHFLPAYGGLSADARERLKALSGELKNDNELQLQLRHTLTDADVARSAQRANPSRDTALQLAAAVRTQKADLVRQYGELSAKARGDFGAQANAAAEATAADLRDVGRQLAKAEQSLDSLYALTTPGAAMQADRRTRAAVLDVGRARLEATKAELVRGLPAGIAERVQTANPQPESTPGEGGGDVTIVLVRKKS